MHEVGPYTALDCTFTVRTAQRGVADYLRWLFRHLASASSSPGRVFDLGESIPALVRAIDEEVIDSSSRLLIHAGGVVHDGSALVIPSRTGGGKSTLTAALVRSGLGYVTDEFVSPDWDSGDVLPYPRMISLDPDVWGLLADLEPEVPAAVQPLSAGQWQVDPEAIRPGSLAGPCWVRDVVFPAYEPRAETRVEPVRRTAALVDLAECTFHFHDHGARALDVLAGVLAGADCYRLTYGDLDSACAAVCELVGAR